MLRSTRTSRGALVIALCAMIGIGIGIGIGICGCGMEEASVISATRTIGEQTLQEQWEWAATQVEQVIARTETPGRWKGESDAEPSWERERQRILGEAERSSCTFRAGQVNPAQLLVGVWADDIDGDVFALAGRVRERWQTEGWSVSDVIRREDTIAGNEIQFRADSDRGAMLSLKAVSSDERGMLFLTVQAECSRHPSVAW